MVKTGKRYLISRQQLEYISASLGLNTPKEIDSGSYPVITEISTKQEVFSSTNTILLDVGFVKEYISIQRISSIIVKKGKEQCLEYL